MLQSETFVVSSSEELHDALLHAGSGDTILLKDGVDAYTLNAHAGFNFPYRVLNAPINIKPYNSDSKPVFDSIRLQGIDNVQFENVAIEPVPGGRNWAIQIKYCSNISVVNSRLEGYARDAWWGDGERGSDGIGVVQSSNVDIMQNSISGFAFAVEVRNSDSVRINSNDITRIQVDGIRLSGVQTLEINNNFIADWIGVAYELSHPDFIHMWTLSGTRDSTDVSIVGNALIASNRWATQSILLGTGSQNDSKNFLIKDNIIVNGQLHGITISGADNVEITDNILIHNIESAMRRFDTESERSGAPNIRVEGDYSNVIVKNNIAQKLYFSRNDAVTNNDNTKLIYDNAYDPLYYKTVLAQLAETDTDPRLQSVLNVLGIVDGGVEEGTNTPPIAQDDYAESVDGSAIVVDVLANDMDPEGGPLTVISVDEPANGVIGLVGTTIVYEPDSGFVGEERLIYEIADNEGAVSSAVIVVQVSQSTGVEALTLRGGRSDNDMVGGAGDDTFLIRWGADTAFGSTGADTFVFDGRYVYEGDHHRIDDLDFSEGDSVVFRFFSDDQIRIRGIEDLEQAVAAGFTLSETTRGEASISVMSPEGNLLAVELGDVPYAAATPFF